MVKIDLVSSPVILTCSGNSVQEAKIEKSRACFSKAFKILMICAIFSVASLGCLLRQLNLYSTFKLKRDPQTFMN